MGNVEAVSTKETNYRTPLSPALVVKGVTLAIDQTADDEIVVRSHSDRPISPKKQKHDESQKLKKIITKTVNAAMEDDLRAQALDGKRSLRVRKEVAPAPAPKQTKKKGKK
uniref:Uncharacterized protein n=1 Tax=Timema shepardi TaxID=629360 RepID=A0A7R9AQT9_TIMSH|nr:unnamed protein product [Timema shepardi]